MEKNKTEARAGLTMKKRMERAWTHSEKKWWQHCQTSTTVYNARPHRKTATKKHLEKRPVKRNVKSRFQVQLE